MKEKLEEKIRSMLTETTLNMEKYETRWFDLIDDSTSGVALFQHTNGHNIEVKFGFDENGDITDFRIDLEY